MAAAASTAEAVDRIMCAVDSLGPWNDQDHADTFEATVHRGVAWGLTVEQALDLATASFAVGRLEGDADATAAAAAERAGD
jgi:hypothetical protein